MLSDNDGTCVSSLPHPPAPHACCRAREHGAVSLHATQHVQSAAKRVAFLYLMSAGGAELDARLEPPEHLEPP